MTVIKFIEFDFAPLFIVAEADNVFFYIYSLHNKQAQIDLWNLSKERKVQCTWCLIDFTSVPFMQPAE